MGWGCQVGHKSSPEELQTPLVLQPMQCARHLETAATQLLGQAYHLDDHTLGAYGVAAVAMDKVDDAAVDAFAVAAPTAGVSLLDKRREKIEIVDTEDRKTVYQLIDFVFADADDAAGRQGAVEAGIMGAHAKQRFGLEQERSRSGLCHRIGPVVGRGDDLYPAVDEKEEAVASGLGTRYGVTLGILVETQTGMGHQRTEVGLAQSLEEGKLEQLVVYMQRVHRGNGVRGGWRYQRAGSAILSRSAGEHHTAWRPSRSV